jgi:glycine/D-amino acid oxidase-like deaminating enzyme
MATTDGHEIEASALVYATGYELAEGVPSNGHRRTSTWAFATRPQRERLQGHHDIVWEASNPYLYLRTTADGRMIVGGEDAPFDDASARDALLPRKIASLRAKLQAVRPDVDTEPDYAWAGTFGESADGLPSIGPVPGAPNCYAVLGYGGNGITFGKIAAELILSMLKGRRDPDRKHFDFR